jgi:hypothetical protein
MTTPTHSYRAHAVPFGAGAAARDINWKNLTDFYKRRREWNEREDRWVMREYVRVWIDVSKLDAMLRLKQSDYVGFAGQDGILGKYTGVDEFVRSQKDALLMPRVGVHSPSHKVVEILDGRHRFAWMRDHGAQALPVSAPADEVREIAKLVGTKLRVCRVTMRYIPELVRAA